MALRADEDVDVLLVDLDEPFRCADDAPREAHLPHHRWRHRLTEATALAALAAVVLGDLLSPDLPVALETAGAGGGSATTARAGYDQLAPGVWVDSRTAERVAVARVRSASPQDVVVPADAHRGSAPLPVMLTEDGARYVVVVSCLRPTPLGVGLAGSEAAPRTCPDGAPVYRFTGRGHLVQVVVEVPDDVVWAAEVVTG
ncbi:hypothetical protein [Quadrisphaera setariae]|uniref:Uncharacterized protein n=1 Tax=Quadrisphaera setariae TaxID=2593304 RepID=A0A5C8ZE85_9ACTN|nr:hypothetical protein [Quadrisphaera setariae]TXR55513.1 hypothetical protein FMM08_14500 [Quadrisphaera setariae]